MELDLDVARKFQRCIYIENKQYVSLIQICFF